MKDSNSLENTDTEVQKSTNTGVSQSEMQNEESIVPSVITYAPIHLGYDTAYKTRLTGKLKVAEIVHNIIVVMVTRLVSIPGSYINIFINYLLAISATGICISGLILFLQSSGIIDLYFKKCKSFWMALVIAYLSTIVYSWDLWSTLKLLRKQRKKSDISLILNPTSSIVS